jgi:hypothetical protein
MDVQQLLQLADDLKPWAPVVSPLVRFGVKQAQAIARRFRDHYQHDAPATQALGVQNGADATRRLRDEIAVRIERGELSEDQAAAAFERPDVAKRAQEALLEASETPDVLCHDELAKLIAARLVAPPHSRLDILLRMACDQLPYLNARQLQSLGMAFAVLYVEPDRPTFESADTATYEIAYRKYLDDLRDTVAPFRRLPPPDTVDFMHFEALGLAKLSSWVTSPGFHLSDNESQSSLLSLFQNEFYAKAIASIGSPAPHDPNVEWIRVVMGGDAGEIGYCMYCILQGQPFDLRAHWLGADSESPIT